MTSSGMLIRDVYCVMNNTYYRQERMYVKAVYQASLRYLAVAVAVHEVTVGGRAG